jgi:hypothetical protein
MSKEIVPSDVKEESKLKLEHKEVVSKIFKILQENGYSFWDAQQVTGLVIGAVNTEDPTKALKTATEISELFKQAKLDKIYASTLLQIMADKINTQVNQLSLNSLQIEEE